MITRIVRFVKRARAHANTLRIQYFPAAESELYCYSTDPGRRRAEIPEDDNNHALGALRYLIAKLDARKLGRKPKPPSTPPQPESTEKPKEKKWLSLKNVADLVSGPMTARASHISPWLPNSVRQPTPRNSNYATWHLPQDTAGNPFVAPTAPDPVAIRLGLTITRNRVSPMAFPNRVRERGESVVAPAFIG
jgi:hypothetical protein